MTWTYSGDPAFSDKDEVRYLIGDTTSSEPFVQDEEIAYALGKWKDRLGSVIGVAAVVAETLANRFARELTVTGDGISVPAGDLQNRFEQVVTNLRDMAKEEGLTDAWIDDFSGVLGAYDDSIPSLDVALGMHDNIEAGSQYPAYRRSPFGNNWSPDDVVSP